MKKRMMALCVMAASMGISCSTSREQASEASAETYPDSRPSVVSNTSGQAFSSVSMKASPPVIIYKTTKDYSRHVPVELNESGTEIVSYPAVSDVKIGDRYPYPTQLEEGYLLDNRGIGRHVAFLSYTYEEYAALPATPSRAELLEKVIDKHPLTEIHRCGNHYQYKDIVAELNEQIRAGKFKE